MQIPWCSRVPWRGRPEWSVLELRSSPSLWELYLAPSCTNKPSPPPSRSTSKYKHPVSHTLTPSSMTLLRCYCLSRRSPTGATPTGRTLGRPTVMMVVEVMATMTTTTRWCARCHPCPMARGRDHCRLWRPSRPSPSWWTAQTKACPTSRSISFCRTRWVGYGGGASAAATTCTDCLSARVVLCCCGGWCVHDDACAFARVLRTLY